VIFHDRHDDAFYCQMIRHLNWQQALALQKDGCHQFEVCDSGQQSGLLGARPDPLVQIRFRQHHLVTLSDFFRHENPDGVSLDLIGPRLACFAALCSRLSIYRQNRSCP